MPINIPRSPVINPGQITDRVVRATTDASGNTVTTEVDTYTQNGGSTYAQTQVVDATTYPALIAKEQQKIATSNANIAMWQQLEAERAALATPTPAS